jgi:hypothetical protein
MTEPDARLLVARHLGVLNRWERYKKAGRPGVLYTEIDIHGVPRRALTFEQLGDLAGEHRAALKRIAVTAVRAEIRAELAPYADVINAWRGAWAGVVADQGFDPLDHSAGDDSEK